MFGSGNQPRITGPWQYGSDRSTHKIGLAATDQQVDGQPVLALGSENSNQPEFVTANQITKLANDVTEGRFDSLLAK